MSSGSLNSSCSYFPVPRCIIGIDILRSWQNAHVGSMTCGVRTIVVSKGRWKPLELLLPGNIVIKNSISCFEEEQKLVLPSRI